MTITLWTIFEILINFYQGGLETWFIYRFLTPRSHERAKIWAVIFVVCEGCLVTAFNYFTVFEGFGSALYWASLLVFAFCFFSDNIPLAGCDLVDNVIGTKCCIVIF